MQKLNTTTDIAEHEKIFKTKFVFENVEQEENKPRHEWEKTPTLLVHSGNIKFDDSSNTLNAIFLDKTLAFIMEFSDRDVIAKAPLSKVRISAARDKADKLSFTMIVSFASSVTSSLTRTSLGNKVIFAVKYETLHLYLDTSDYKFKSYKMQDTVIMQGIYPITLSFAPATFALTKSYDMVDDKLLSRLNIKEHDKWVQFRSSAEQEFAYDKLLSWKCVNLLHYEALLVCKPTRIRIANIMLIMNTVKLTEDCTTCSCGMEDMEYAKFDFILKHNTNDNAQVVINFTPNYAFCISDTFLENLGITFSNKNISAYLRCNEFKLHTKMGIKHRDFSADEECNADYPFFAKCNSHNNIKYLFNGIAHFDINTLNDSVKGRMKVNVFK